MIARESNHWEDVATFSGDITSEKDISLTLGKIHDLEAVINCAAIVPVGAVEDNPIRAMEVNALGVVQIAEGVANLWPRAHFLHVSSSHVYQPSEHPLSEESPTVPSSLYGATKLAGEQLLQAFCQTKRLNFGIARVFSLYSEDQEGSYLFPSIMRRATQAPAPSPIKLPGWNNVRDFSHANVLSQTICKLATLKTTGLINVGSGIGTSVGEFARQITGIDWEFDPEDAFPQPTSIVADTSLLRKLLEDGEQL